MQDVLIRKDLTKPQNLDSGLPSGSIKFSVDAFPVDACARAISHPGLGRPAWLWPWGAHGWPHARTPRLRTRVFRLVARLVPPATGTVNPAPPERNFQPTWQG